jgi:peptidoglycan/LPS O-acetylase OafA/YrhL
LLIRVARQSLVYATGMVIVFMLFSVAASGRASFLRWKPLTFLGSILCPLYLIHQSIGFRIQDQVLEGLGMHAFIGFAAALVAAVLLSPIVTFGVERRAQRWIRLANARLREART